MKITVPTFLNFPWVDTPTPFSTAWRTYWQKTKANKQVFRAHWAEHNNAFILMVWTKVAKSSGGYHWGKHSGMVMEGQLNFSFLFLSVMINIRTMEAILCTYLQVCKNFFFHEHSNFLSWNSQLIWHCFSELMVRWLSNLQALDRKYHCRNCKIIWSSFERRCNFKWFSCLTHSSLWVIGKGKPGCPHLQKGKWKHRLNNRPRSLRSQGQNQE